MHASGTAPEAPEAPARRRPARGGTDRASGARAGALPEREEGSRRPRPTPRRRRRGGSRLRAPGAAHPRARGPAPGPRRRRSSGPPRSLLARSSGAARRGSPPSAPRAENRQRASGAGDAISFLCTTVTGGANLAWRSRREPGCDDPGVETPTGVVPVPDSAAARGADDLVGRSTGRSHRRPADIAHRTEKFRTLPGFTGMT